MASEIPVLYDDEDNYCFGCSPNNPHGLKLEFRRTGERGAECHFTAPPHVMGATDILHGGIQATVLDEVMGVAVRTALALEIGHDVAASANLVTAEFSLRYRRPVPTGSPLIIRGWQLRSEGRDHFVEGVIESESGERLTLAEARWCHLA